MIADFYRGKKIFITGHTGFKGSWLCLWLHHLGAEVTGYALEPPTDPSLFVACDIVRIINSQNGDVRDAVALTKAMQEAQPDIVIHMAAQPLVRDSYKVPVETYEINVMGTVNLLEAVRQTPSVRAVINVTTDKCYENKEWLWGYRENEPMGGYDPYSSSKACSELVTAAYRSSFFTPEKYNKHGVALASVRAGNVIGGGDWATDRLIPDCLTALSEGRNIVIRHPEAIRPWQHVLEPLYGYMLLAKKLFNEGSVFAEAWNFGPPQTDAKSVGSIAEKMCEVWGGGSSVSLDNNPHPHEAMYLKLDCSKAASLLNWHPLWSIDDAIKKIVEWAKAYQQDADMNQICLKQINDYMEAVQCKL